MDIPSEKKEQKTFNIIKRAKSFTHAGRGIRLFLESTHNAWVQIVIGMIVVGLGFYFRITTGEWLAIVLSIGIVLVTEALNTAVEFDMNLTSSGRNPFARDVKDIAAGAVLIAALTAFALGLIIFLPKFGLF